MKNYLIIGASSGIGFELAQTLKKGGHHVFATYNANPVENEPGIEYHTINVLDNTLDFSFLPDVLDGIIYCPGSINLKPFARIKPDEFISDYNLVTVGAVKVIQCVLNRLKKSDHAGIILFSTVAVQTGFTFHSQVASSKGAIEGLTRALAAELAPKIRVNCIAPSITDTPLASYLLNSEDKKLANAQRHPLKRIGSSEDIANLASFLLSEQASWITGQIMHADGGISTLKS